MDNKLTDIKKYAEILECFKIGLINNLFELSEIINWVDQRILESDNPNENLIDLSLCNSINEAISIINKFVGSEKPIISARAVLGFTFNCYKSNQIDLARVIKTINWINYQTEISEDEKSLMYAIDDEYELAVKNIYGEIKDIEYNVLKILELYEDFCLENYKNWGKLNMIVPQKIEKLFSELKEESETNKKYRWKFWK